MPLQSVSLDLTQILKPFFPHNLSLPLVPILQCLPFRSMITEFPVQKTQSLSKHSLLDEKERLLWDSPTPTFHFCISQTWWRIVDFLRWFSSHLCFWFFCVFVQGGDKLRYHFRDDGFRLWTALKRLILNQKRMHVFCFVFYPLKFVGMFMGLSGESTPQMDRLILNIIWCHCGRISFYSRIWPIVYVSRLNSYFFSQMIIATNWNIFWWSKHFRH